MESFEEGLKLGSLEMLAHRKMKNSNFCFCSRMLKKLYPFSVLDLSFYKGDRVHKDALLTTVYTDFSHDYSTY